MSIEFSNGFGNANPEVSNTGYAISTSTGISWDVPDVKIWIRPNPPELGPGLFGIRMIDRRGNDDEGWIPVSGTTVSFKISPA